jgi:hypothetical protein
MWHRVEVKTSDLTSVILVCKQTNRPSDRFKSAKFSACRGRRMGSAPSVKRGPLEKVGLNRHRATASSLVQYQMYEEGHVGSATNLHKKKKKPRQHKDETR